MNVLAQIHIKLKKYFTNGGGQFFYLSLWVEDQIMWMAFSICKKKSDFCFTVDEIANFPSPDQ